MTQDPRYIAFAVLQDAGSGTVTLDQSLDRYDGDISGLDSKDRALCNAVVFGVLRHRGRLDHLIRTFSDRPFESIDQGVIQVLRIALFQMVFLDRVPDFAAIDTSVDLAKKKISKNSSGFVNAVLRKAAKEHKGLKLPSRARQFTAYLKVAFSIPTWLGNRWVKEYGKEKTEHLCRSLLEIPPLTLRTNTLQTDRSQLMDTLNRSGITTEKTDSLSGIHISHPGIPLSELPGFSSGFFQVQDEAAQLVTQVLNPKPGEAVLDACAGLGGKACHMAQLMDNQGTITAADIEASKLDRLAMEADRLGISIIQGRAIDVTRATVNEFGRYFDRVLVDAPCTGLGVIRRNPDTRWKRGIKDIQRMAARQKKILNAAASLVKPGGVLVYAVCSCEPDENQAVIAHFLDKRKDFCPDRGAVARLVPGDSRHTPEAYWLKTFPDPGTMDGFFVARLKRKDRS